MRWTDQMPVQVERVVHGRMDGKELLRRTSALEALHLAFLSSGLLMRVLRHSGPLRRARLAEPGAAALSLHRAHLRRCRILGTEDGEYNRRHGMLEDRDRQPFRSAPLRRPPRREECRLCRI